MATGDASTTINYDAQSATLLPGEIVEYETNAPHVVTATSPIYAYQVLVSQGSEPNQPLTGDPAMIAIPPVEQFQFDYFLYIPGTFSNNFINVMSPNGMALTIDGTPQTIDCTNEIAGTIDGLDYCCQGVSINEGVHVIEGTQAFGLYATGFDQYASYGYTGGTGVQAISSGCDSGGPYLAMACEAPVVASLGGSASCPDGSTPLTFWSTPDITLGFDDVTYLSTNIFVNVFGSFSICLEVLCGSEVTQCCSSIDVVQMTPDGNACS